MAQIQQQSHGSRETEREAADQQFRKSRRDKNWQGLVKKIKKSKKSKPKPERKLTQS
jgi:hypothetical protein